MAKRKNERRKKYREFWERSTRQSSLAPPDGFLLFSGEETATAAWSSAYAATGVCVCCAMMRRLRTLAFTSFLARFALAGISAFA